MKNGRHKKMVNKNISKKEKKRQERYDEMLEHPNNSGRGWLSEKPYQFVYKERLEHGKSEKQV